jgi:hypothetical protein
MSDLGAEGYYSRKAMEVNALYGGIIRDDER